MLSQEEKKWVTAITDVDFKVEAQLCLWEWELRLAVNGGDNKKVLDDMALITVTITKTLYHVTLLMKIIETFYIYFPNLETRMKHW